MGKQKERPGGRSFCWYKVYLARILFSQFVDCLVDRVHCRTSFIEVGTLLCTLRMLIR